MSLTSGKVTPSFSLHALLAIGKSVLMPTTWAWRLSNLARSSWKAATSRVQVGVKADRKSTRLNSSHGYISYAVFCLKKKNGNKEPLTARGLYMECHKHAAT